MARIRTVKPEFWSDEKLAPLTPVDRLVFLGLISMADDFGRLLDNLKTIDAFVFPCTDDSARESLATLSRLGRIVRGMTASGQPVIQIPTWHRHQKVDKPSKRASLPELVSSQHLSESSRDTRETVARLSRDSRVTTSDLGPPTTDHRPPTEEDDADRRKAPQRPSGRTGTPTEEDRAEATAATAADQELDRFGSERATIAGFLARFPMEQQPAWRGRLLGLLDGIDLPGPATPGAIAAAIRDLEGGPLPSPAKLRAFVQRAQDAGSAGDRFNQALRNVEARQRKAAADWVADHRRAEHSPADEPDEAEVLPPESARWVDTGEAAMPAALIAPAGHAGAEPPVEPAGQPTAIWLATKAELARAAATEGASDQDPEAAEGFARFWAVYPRRLERATAERAWTARVREGIDPAALIAGAERYAAKVAADRIEAKFVKYPATFLGPDRHWDEPHDPTPKRRVAVYDEHGNATPEMARLAGLT